MNLPLVLDIAIGVIFIYLILSLLASEIQELIATVLQWRAEHLKKSIEVLFTGDNDDNQAVQQFTNEFYRNPLIRSLNQEAKGVLARSFRKISHAMGDFYRTITRTRNVFDDRRSGPSYIPSETFAVALLQKLDIESLSQKVSELTLLKFSEEKLAVLEGLISDLRNCAGDDLLLQNEIDGLKQNLGETLRDFINQRTSFSAAVEQIVQQLSQFIDNADATLAEDDPCREIIRKRLPYARQAITLKRLEPTISEVVTMIVDKSQNPPPQIREILSRIHQNNPYFPKQLQRNLNALAKQAQLKAQSLDAGVRQLQIEVEDWFNRSMDRASGVYRRNAKGIAIALGFLIAVATNADSFHIVSRLSKDNFIRSTISQAADQVIARQAIGSIPNTAPSLPDVSTPDTLPPDDPFGNLPEGTEPPLPAPDTLSPEAVVVQQNLEAVKDAVDGVLEGLPLPIGWNEVNVAQQAVEGRGWIPFLRRILGWLVTGIAISMGASFWFDLLSKVVKVRNSGKPARSSSTDES